MLTMIEKRNGELESFNRQKIEEAVFKSLVATKPSRLRKDLQKLTEVVADYVLLEIENSTEKYPKVEAIQDAVEHAMCLPPTYKHIIMLSVIKRSKILRTEENS